MDFEENGAFSNQFYFPASPLFYLISSLGEQANENASN